MVLAPQEYPKKEPQQSAAKGESTQAAESEYQ
jgi:hypothetical protein